MSRKIFRSFRDHLLETPSPADVASVVRATPIGALITAINAILFSLGTAGTLGGPGLALWLVLALSVCFYIFGKSRRVRGVSVTRVSRRAHRRLLMTTLLLALPWSVLAVWIIPTGSHFERLLALLVCTGMFTGAASMLQRVLSASLTFAGVVTGGVVIGCVMAAERDLLVIIPYAILCAGFVTGSGFLAGETARERDRMLEEVSETHRALEKAYGKISSFALVDSVTGLKNRKAFGHAAEKDIAAARARGDLMAMLLFDLDNFKNVNDSFGHHVGDELLRLSGQRILGTLSGKGVLARLGGDEFAVLVPVGGGHRRVEDLARSLISAVSESLTIGGRCLYPNTSIGIALYPDHAEELNGLLRKADAALTRAKERGKGGWVLFDNILGRELEDTDLIVSELSEALETGALSVHYQPKIDLRTGAMRGAEALLRWQHPELGPLPPDRFLSAAAERAMMHRLSAFVFARVARDILAWREEGLDVGQVAINIHPVDLKDPDHLMDLIRGLRDQGIGPGSVSLEITEGCFFGRGTEASAMILDAIADMGFHLALDDFGTGHAALTHLRSLPVHEIKIDRSFVENVARSESDRAIVDATIAIARGMGLTSVAEGVETIEQIVVLRDMGADIAQGYYWARPLPPEGFADFIMRRRDASRSRREDRAPGDTLKRRFGTG